MSLWKRTGQRYSETPEPITPYQKAAKVWDDRLGSARVQAKNWRLMAFASFSVIPCLVAVMAWQSVQSRITPYVVEVDAQGAVRTVGPAVVAYEPNDAQIAYHLAAFIKRVRSVSIDPIIVRENWLRAYDFTTDRAANTLNEYARDNDPFTSIGRRSVTITINSVVRASTESFQVDWTEESFENGTLATSETWTAILTIVIQQPATADLLERNPLGIFVHGLNWSRDIKTGGSQ